MANGSRPDFRVFTSRESGDKTYYTDVGAAWKVSNDGISIQLHALPVDGRLVLFPPREEREEPPPATVAPVKRK